MPMQKKLLHRLLGVCVQHAQTLSAALYVASLVAFFGLPLAAKRNYLDENALLAGFAHSQIRYSSAFSNGKDTYRSAVDTEGDPIQLAEAMLDSMRIDHWRSSSLSVQCKASTMHAILRAPRGDGKEAIVLATPVHGSGSAAAAAGNFAAIQVAVTVLQFLQKVPWLAKDIVWVVVDAECSVLRATKDWLAAYDSCPSHDHAAFGRSGLLQQALVLEMNSDRFNALQVRTLGWNGQLPMLDLYYLIKRLSESGPGLQLSQKTDTPFLNHIPAKLRHYWRNMWQVIAFSWQQATTMPTGIHAEFIRHGVDAVTIETYIQPSAGAWSYGVDEGVTKLAVLLELTVRSLNNLLERFHHSTTFYLLLSPDWHVPFHIHIIPPLLLAVVLVLQAADTAKLSVAGCSNQDEGQVYGNNAAWSHAARTCLCIHVLCNACKLCFVYTVNNVAVLPIWLQPMLAAWQPHSRCAIAMCATGAAIAAWLVTGLCNGNSFGKCSLQHRLYTRTVAQGVAAAQASALICTNWATAFYTMILLVPLLSLPLCLPKWLQRAHVGLTMMLVVLLFVSCFVIVSDEAYAPLMQNMSRQARSEDTVDNATLTSLLSWHTNSLSALLAILLPACMVVLQ